MYTYWLGAYNTKFGLPIMSNRAKEMPQLCINILLPEKEARMIASQIIEVLEKLDR